MMLMVRYVNGVEDGIDFDAHYSIGKPDVAWTLLGWAQKWEACKTLITVNEDGEYDPDGEEVEVDDPTEGEFIDDRDFVIAVMVGDDTRHQFDKSEPVVLAEDAFCRGCGQVGCRCEVWV